MSELSTEQIFNIYILRIYLVYKNCRLFLVKYNYRFYCKLPKSEDLIIDIKYNSILIIINKFTKYAYLIPSNKDFTAK